MTVREIIERHPRPLSLDRDVLLRCIDKCFDCAATCTSCADACLGESDVPELVRCVRLNLDCADVCEDTGRVVTRQTEPDLGLVRASVDGVRGRVSCVCRGVRSSRAPPRPLPCLRRGLSQLRAGVQRSARRYRLT